MHRLYLLNKKSLQFLIAFIALTGASLSFGDGRAAPADRLPAVDHVWTGAEYAAASETLAAGKVKLPRFDRTGSATMKRLSSLDGLAWYRDARTPVETRFRDYAQLATGASTIINLYLKAWEKDPGLHDEMAAVSVFVAHVGALGIDIGDEFVAELKKTGRFSPKVQEGLNTMYGGAGQVFEGLEQSVWEPSSFSADNRSAFLQALAVTLPVLERTLDANRKSALRERLKSHRDGMKRNADRQNIDRMLKLL